MSHDTDKNISLGYGPHSKFSRGDEMYALQNYFTMVTEKKFICSLDLLLDVFSKSCQIPGCANVPHVKYHFVGTLSMPCVNLGTCFISANRMR